MTSRKSPVSSSPRIGIDALGLGTMTSDAAQPTYRLLQHLPQAAPEFDYLVYHSAPIDAPDMRMRRARPLTHFRPMRVLWRQAALPVRTRLDRVDLIHAPSSIGPIATSKPVVLTIHNTIALSHPNLSKRSDVWHARLFMRASARRAVRIITPSEATCKDVINVLGVPPDKIRVVPLGVSEAFRPVEEPDELRRARRELRLPERYILYTGSIEPRRNLPALLRAYAEARRSGRVTHRLVVALSRTWKHVPLLRTLRELHIEKTVQFVGPVPEAQLPVLYSGASVFVFPSLHEGFGLPVLEAMACGTPVVTTKAGALPEVVGNAAITVRPNDVRELRIAMEKVLANQFLARRLREYGIQRAAEFSWQKTARAAADVYAEALEAAGA